MEVPCVVLNNGEKIPVLGLGCGGDGSPDLSIVEATTAAALQASVTEAALQAGYRHFDTAAVYGSERGIGNALQKAFASEIVSRKDVFVVSKLWCADMHPDYVLPALKKSLEELQLEYLDLYLIHWPLRVTHGKAFRDIKPEDLLPVALTSCWKVLEKCVEAGLVKSIGVSNFSPKKLESLLSSATIPPTVNQVEMHPMWQQRKLREYCKSKGIHVTAYSPMGAPYINKAGLLHHPLLVSIASKHGKNPAQVALRWAIEEGASVIPSSNNPHRIKENMQIFDFSLDEDDKLKLASLEQRKNYEMESFVNPKDGPYHSLYELWDDEAFLEN